MDRGPHPAAAGRLHPSVEAGPDLAHRHGVVRVVHARTGGVIVRVVPPWDKPFLRLFQVSKDVGRDVERLIQQHR